MPEDELLVTADHWDAYVDRHMVDGQNTNRAEWLAHPVVQAHHERERGGRSIESWVAEVALGGTRMDCGVGIGAGTGSLELSLVASDSVHRFDLLDVSPGALDLARTTAQTLGIAERVSTFNTEVGSFDLGQRRYDLATCMGSLHHVAELDDVLQATSRSLAPNGVLVAYEYVGPDRLRQARSSDASPSSLPVPRFGTQITPPGASFA